MKKQTKEKKDGLKPLKSLLFALKTLHKLSPGYILSRILAQFSYWFFTGFIQEILFLRLILNIIETGGSFKDFATTVIIFALSSVIATGINCTADYYISKKNKVIFKNLNDMIFKKAVNIDMACYDNSEFYNKYKRATEIYSGGHYDELAFYFASVFAGGITGIFILVYVVTVDPRILALLLLSLPLIIFQSIKGKVEVEKDKEMTFHKRSKDYVKRIIHLKDYAKDIRTSYIFSVLSKRNNDSCEGNIKAIKKYGKKIALIEVLTGIFGEALPIVCAYAYATFRYAIKKNLALADFSVIMTAMSNLRDVVNDVGGAIAIVKREALFFDNLREFTEYEKKIVNGSLVAEPLESIEFKNVTFTYPDSTSPTLNNLNVIFNRGETTAVVGQNGAGKSTFVKLLLRFYDPQEGEILYNGVNLKEYDINSLRQRLATVFQDYKVFALSIGENVLCREVETDRDREILDFALKSSGADTFVDELPQKEETVISREFDEKGTGLSGGQQQKLCVARMFAKDFDIAILDEPSSALDPIAEYNMYESLIKATEHKTVIYISHRLSSAVLSDKIYVFGDGAVQESGTHKELMEKGGIYTEMFTLQAESYKESEGGATAV